MSLRTTRWTTCTISIHRILFFFFFLLFHSLGRVRSILSTSVSNDHDVFICSPLLALSISSGRAMFAFYFTPDRDYRPIVSFFVFSFDTYTIFLASPSLLSRTIDLHLADHDHHDVFVFRLPFERPLYRSFIRTTSVFFVCLSVGACSSSSSSFCLGHFRFICICSPSALHSYPTSFEFTQPGTVSSFIPTSSPSSTSFAILTAS